MKLAAARALAELTREPVPDSRDHGVRRQDAEDGPRLLHPQAVRSARAVVGRAGGREGGDGSRASRASSSTSSEYRERLMSKGSQRRVLDHAHDRPRGAARSEAHRVPARRRTRACLRAVQQIVDEGIAKPVLLGRQTEIAAMCEEMSLDMLSRGVEIIDPRTETNPQATSSGSTSCASARA